MRNPHRKAVAVHEAGHAVGAHRYGIAVEAATIEPAADYLGRVRLRVAAPPDGLDANARTRFNEGLFQTNVIVFLAGPAAQRMIYPRSHVPVSAAGDRREAEHYVRLLAGSVTAERALWRFCELEARHLVETYRHRVAGVAEALLAYTTISGDEIEAVIAGADEVQARIVAEERERMKASDTTPTEADALHHHADMVRASRPITRRDAAGAALNFILAHPDRFDLSEVASFADFTPEGFAKDAGAVREKLVALAAREAAGRQIVERVELDRKDPSVCGGSAKWLN
ncbi:hypothetical protein L1787_17875 [Acuticoccus sp. M5D2P5]|uniref:hypothetical protein n=1 Tax=Acuticoccus kalidii TaxID=2910977 RepID=UPI001F1E60D3|nr:hypothetical protein [Acuticoccus kalidii]MCF3935272.1 hypothetical protein [Acuticoccus kalidii]